MSESRSTPPRLRWRALRHDDLPEACGLLPAWTGLASDDPRIATLWHRLVDEPAITSTVMEDLARPAGARLQGWGCGLVMPEATARSLGLDGRAPRPPAPVVPELYRRLLAGSLPLPDDRELGRHNAAGTLQFFNLHYGQRGVDLDDDHALAVLNTAHEAFRVAVSGWLLQAMYIEGCALDTPTFLASGFHAVPYAEATGLDGLPERLRPAFFAITRDQARRTLPGVSARHAFEHVPPRFRLSAAQRRLLWRALCDENDEQLMQALDVSVHGLKKLWRGLYERIEAVEPAFFGEDAGGSDDGKRGPEKRRQVLAYVRQRTEELRPWLP